MDQLNAEFKRLLQEISLEKEELSKLSKSERLKIVSDEEQLTLLFLSSLSEEGPR